MINKALTFFSRRYQIDLHYLAKGGFWLLLTQGITVTGSFISTAIIAHFLTNNDFGVYRYLVSLAVLFTTFSLTGMAQAVLQTAAKGYLDFFKYSVRTNLIYGLGICIAALCGSVYYLSKDNLPLAIGCILIALIQPFISSFQNIVPFLQGLKKFKESALLQIFKVTTITVISTAVVFITRDTVILFLAFLSSQVFANIAGALFFSFKYHTSSVTEEAIKKRYVRFAQHISLQNVISGLATRIDSILVFQLLGASSLATFAVATILPDQIKGAFKNLVPLLVPKLSKYKNLEDFPFFYKRNLQFLLILLFSTVALVFIFPYIYMIFFPKYASAIFYAQLLLLSVPSNLMLIPQSALQSHLKERELYLCTTYSSIFQILITVFLIYYSGILGAIFARILSRYFLAILSYYYFFKAKN